MAITDNVGDNDHYMKMPGIVFIGRSRYSVRTLSSSCVLSFALSMLRVNPYFRLFAFSRSVVGFCTGSRRDYFLVQNSLAIFLDNIDDLPRHVHPCHVAQELRQFFKINTFTFTKSSDFGDNSP